MYNDLLNFVLKSIYKYSVNDEDYIDFKYNNYTVENSDIKDFSKVLKNRIDVKNKYIMFDILSSYDINLIKNIERVIQFYYEICKKSEMLNTLFEDKFSENVQFIKFKNDHNNFYTPSFLKTRDSIEKNINVYFKLTSKNSVFTLNSTIDLPFSKGCPFSVTLNEYTEEEFIKIQEQIKLKCKNRLREIINYNSNNLKIEKRNFKNMELEAIIDIFKLMNLIEY